VARTGGNRPQVKAETERYHPPAWNAEARSRVHERTNLRGSPSRWTISAPLVSGGKISAADLNLTTVIYGAGYKLERMRTWHRSTGALRLWRRTVGRGEPLRGRGRSGRSIGERCARFTNEGSEESDRTLLGMAYLTVGRSLDTPPYRQGKPCCIGPRVCEARSRLSCNWQFLHGGPFSNLRSKAENSQCRHRFLSSGASGTDFASCQARQGNTHDSSCGKG
jgi:hypothetical protein